MLDMRAYRAGYTVHDATIGGVTSSPAWPSGGVDGRRAWHLLTVSSCRDILGRAHRALRRRGPPSPRGSTGARVTWAEVRSDRQISSETEARRSRCRTDVTPSLSPRRTGCQGPDVARARAAGCAHLGPALVRDERHDGAHVAGASRATRPVDVGVWVVGRVEMDHAGDGIDVDAPGHDVGGHQGVGLADRERGQCPRPLGLRPVAVDGSGCHPCGPELTGHAVGAPLRPTEDERPAVPLDQPSSDVESFRPLGVPEQVGDCVDIGSFWRDDATAGLVLVSAADGLHFAGHGGGEDQHLAVVRRLVDEPSDRRKKSHVDHPVSLVEDHDVNAVEAHVPTCDQVFEPARTGDHDVDATSKCLALGAVPGAAVDDGNAALTFPVEGGQDGVHLLSQLAGRDEHQAAG